MRFFLLLIIAATACNDPEAGTSEVTDDLTNTPCATLPPDALIYVPETFTNATLYSPSGEYGYMRNSVPTTCQGWIVDVFMATYSNLNPDPHGVPTNPTGELIAAGGAYDLPSSAGANGKIPTTKNDCNRLNVALYAYTWPHTDTGYTYVAGALYGGTWLNGVCTIGETSTFGTIPKPRASAAGYDRYRYVAGVIERASYQESAVFLTQPPPS